MHDHVRGFEIAREAPGIEQWRRRCLRMQPAAQDIQLSRIARQRNSTRLVRLLGFGHEFRQPHGMQ